MISHFRPVSRGFREKLAITPSLPYSQDRNEVDGMTVTELLALAKECGFSHAGELNMAALEFRPEVRDMCAADKCRSYGKNWCCPPHCGSLEDMAARTGGFSRGILVQSTGLLEDEFDFETMAETEKEHKRRFERLTAALRKRGIRCLPMGAGACTVCQSCTCPDEPCRFPERAMPSMEACGLLVGQVCKDSGLGYYYGRGTMTYTACVLVE